jgi:threonine dehydratase
VAYAAARLGAAARVYVPTTAPAVKVARLRELGADVVQVGDRYALAYEAAVADAEETGALFCHAYDQPRSAPGRARSRWSCSTSWTARSTRCSSRWAEAG